MNEAIGGLLFTVTVRVVVLVAPLLSVTVRLMMLDADGRSTTEVFTPVAEPPAERPRVADDAAVGVEGGRRR